MFLNPYIDTKPVKYYPYKLVTPGSGLAVSVANVKAQLRIPSSETGDDTMISALIGAATEQAERFLRRDLLTKTYTLYRDYFEDVMEMRRSPMGSVTSIYYDDVNNVNTLLSPSAYTVSFENDYANILVNPAQGWPNVYNKKESVRITFTAGYGAASDIPPILQQALIVLTIHLYENRGDVEGTKKEAGGPHTNGLPSVARSLLTPYRLRELTGQPIRGRF